MNEYTQPNEPQHADGSDAGPVEQTAGLGLRSLAFIADILLLFVVIITVNQFILTQAFPEGTSDFTQYVEEYGARQQDGPEPALTDEAERYIRAFYAFTILLIWLYFSSLEILTKGSSLGKLIFRIYAVREDGGELSVGATLLRSITKTITLLIFPPFLLFNYLLAFLNRRRKAGHDFLARSRVVVRPQPSSATDPSK